MKLSQRAGLILTGLTLVLAGCETTKETQTEPEAKAVAPAIKIGPAATPGLIIPSPIPLLPYPGTPEAKALKDAKNADAKAQEKMAEPKP